MPDAPVTNQTLESLGPWLHDFKLPDPLRIPIEPVLRTRIWQRRALILPRILDQYPGGSLAGLTVLDLGANAGAWGHWLAEAGASVTCVEPRPENFAQARAIASVVGDRGIRWVQDSAENFLRTDHASYDIVLCLGLLYHLSDGPALLNAAVARCSDLIVLDSHCLNDDTPYVEFRLEPNHMLSQGISDTVTFPSRGALQLLLRLTGVSHVMELANVGDVPDDYRDFLRCAFLGRRSRPLTPPDSPDRNLFLTGPALDRVYPPPPGAYLRERSESRPRAADFYDALRRA